MDIAKTFYRLVNFLTNFQGLTYDLPGFREVAEMELEHLTQITRSGDMKEQWEYISEVVNDARTISNQFPAEVVLAGRKFIQESIERMPAEDETTTTGDEWDIRRSLLLMLYVNAYVRTKVFNEIRAAVGDGGASTWEELAANPKLLPVAEGFWLQMKQEMERVYILSNVDVFWEDAEEEETQWIAENILEPIYAEREEPTSRIEPDGRSERLQEMINRITARRLEERADDKDFAVDNLLYRSFLNEETLEEIRQGPGGSIEPPAKRMATERELPPPLPPKIPSAEEMESS